MFCCFVGKRTCAIGDGGNDVSMIQAADTGVGIVGKVGNFNKELLFTIYLQMDEGDNSGAHCPKLGGHDLDPFVLTPGGITKSSTFCSACFCMGKCSIYFLQSLYFSQFYSRHVYHIYSIPQKMVCYYWWHKSFLGQSYSYKGFGEKVYQYWRSALFWILNPLNHVECEADRKSIWHSQSRKPSLMECNRILEWFHILSICNASGWDLSKNRALSQTQWALSQTF